MQAFPIGLVSHHHHPHSPLLFLQAASASVSLLPRIMNRSLPTRKTIRSSSTQLFHSNSSNIESTTSVGGGGDDVDVNDDGESEGEGVGEDGTELPSIYRGIDDGIEIEIENIGNNSRRIRSRIAIEASLQTVWNILTDYERLAEFIPGLAVSQLLEKRGNLARVFQIGEQKLAFGLNFNAKGVIDCYEKDLENLLFGQRRDIEFKMIEGDFQLFEGKWSIEQYNMESCEDIDFLIGKQYRTTLSYVVDVKPKLWLPVRLVEGRLCREIKMNLSCIRIESQKQNHQIPDSNGS